MNTPAITIIIDSLLDQMSMLEAEVLGADAPVRPRRVLEVVPELEAKTKKKLYPADIFLPALEHMKPGERYELRITGGVTRTQLIHAINSWGRSRFGPGVVEAYHGRGAVVKVMRSITINGEHKDVK